MSETNGYNGRHEQFERRAVQLAAVFKIHAETFEGLPDQFREFCEYIGYTRVCSLLVISDLQRGRSERQLVINYGLTRKQIQVIKENSRLCKRRQDQ
jgi:hypothetical protein